MGGEGEVLWGGCPSRGVGDRGWTSGCVVVGHPDRTWCQNLSSTSAPKGLRDQDNFYDLCYSDFLLHEVKVQP